MKRKKLRIKIARFMIAVMLSTMLSSTFSSVAFARELAGLNSPDGDDVVSEDVMNDGEDLDGEDLGDEDLDDEDPGDEDLDDEDPGDEDLDDEDPGDEDLDDEDLDDEDLDDEDLDDEDIDDEDLDDEDLDDEDLDDEDLDDEDLDDEDLDDEDLDDEDLDDEDIDDEDIDDEDIDGEDLDDEDFDDEDLDVEDISSKVELNGIGASGKKNAVAGGVNLKGLSGWQVIDDETYYYVNGEPVTGIQTIDGSMYGFDYSGVMFKDENFTWGGFYDQEGDYNYNRYHAYSDGKLAVNTWIDNGDEDWGFWKAYYGSDGKGYVAGIYTIGGKKYYFDYYGECYPNRILKIGGKTYVADENGALTEANTGWFEIDGERYYFENGEELKECVKKIGNNYYGFDWKGRMYNDGEFWLGEVGTGTRYHAKEGGTLYVNEWYDSEWTPGEHWFYFGPDAAAYANGAYVIEGKLYCFDGAGQLCKGPGVTINGKTYYIDSEGIAYEAVTNGFFAHEGQKFYFENGEIITNCVKKIGTSYYGFNWRGVMYDNVSFSISYYDDDQGTWFYQYYKAQAGGTLLVNDWYSDGWDVRYYGSNGMAVAGKMKSIDGVNYYFNENAYLVRNTAFTYNGKNYITDQNGVATRVKESGWYLSANGKKYYIENGAFVKACVKKIDGKNYYFTSDGSMLNNSYITEWIDNESQTYEAKEGGELYQNTWREQYGTKRYFGDDCRASKGLKKIGSYKYYFDTYGGGLYTDQFVSVNGKCYVANSSGVLYAVEPNGWTKEIDGNKYYMVDGSALRDCIRKIDGSFYGFDWRGRLYVNIIFGMSAYQDGEYIYNTYAAKANGRLVINNWYSSRYFGPDGAAYKNGVYNINGNLYKFNESGYPMKGVSFTYQGENYATDKNTGIAYKLGNDGWNTIGDEQYYIANGEIIRGTVFTINGVTYLFGSDGRLLCNTVWESGKAVYASDGEGIAKKLDQGWNPVGEKTYYLYNGRILKNIIKEINGNMYAFDYDGSLIKDRGLEYRPASSNSYIPTGSGNNYAPQNDGKHSVNYSTAKASGNNYTPYEASSNAYKTYYADENGVLLKNTWYYDPTDGFWCYFDDTCRKVIGWNNIDGKTYYMDILGVRQKGFITVNGKRYYLNSKGEKQSGGWIDVGKKRYFLTAGGVVKTGFITDNGNRYYLNENGALQTGWVVVNNKRYYADESGALQKGWITVNGKRFYLNSNGVVQTGWIKVGSKKYYASGAGAIKTGWVTIDGKKYYFNDNGVLQTGWITIGSKKYYTSAAGAMKTGWVQIDKNWYYFETNGVMVTGTKKIGNKVYKFKANGVCTNK